MLAELEELLQILDSRLPHLEASRNAEAVAMARDLRTKAVGLIDRVKGQRGTG